MSLGTKNGGGGGGGCGCSGGDDGGSSRQFDLVLTYVGGGCSICSSECPLYERPL